MALYMIGIGLGDEKDISLKGLEAIKRCKKVYLESYTSRLISGNKRLESLYGKEIAYADRDFVENKADIILKEAEAEDVAFLVIGDVFAATTHIDLRLRAIKKGITVKIIHNASIINAVADTGLELYKFGRVISIPFYNKGLRSPISAYKANKKIGLHSLFLLDLDPKNNKYMDIAEAVEYLTINGINEDIMAVGCAGIGSEKQEIVFRSLKELKSSRFSLYPQCLILPAELHFIEEEALKSWG